jgi:hypothetical protein
MALAVASLSPDERRRVLELMEYTTARLEARLSPLGSDFADDEGEPIDQFRRAMAAYVPSFTAARELERGRWESRDLAVRVEATCTGAKLALGETCISLWDTEDGPKEIGHRARFLAWAASRAAVLDLGTPDRAAACASALREHAGAASSVIALVLTADDLALRAVPERPSLQEAARRLGRAMAASDVEDKLHLEAFANAVTEGPGVRWLTLSPTAIAVVPRLSAIARPDALASEIDSAAGNRAVRWLHHP